MKYKKYGYFLHNITGIGNKSLHKLVQNYGNPKDIYELSIPQLEKVLDKRKVTSFLKARENWNIDKQYERLNQKGIDFYAFGQLDYPTRLMNIPDAPYGIYVAGRLPKETIPTVAMIGARNCSDYGRYVARQYGLHLGRMNIQVVSGMARGIDGISQKAAMEGGGNTFGILGCGVDICYPLENLPLFEKIKMQGGIISEFSLGVQPKPAHFPMRNRMISGFCDILVVIEAREKSGTLITVDMALEQGREVYAVPGRVTDNVSGGCNRLIAQGAGVALSPEQLTQVILDKLNNHCILTNNRDETQFNHNRLLNKQEQMIYEKVEITAKSVETIFQEVGTLTIMEVMQLLVELELKGVISSIGMNYYRET